jgi:hypothetical protein
LRFEKTVSCPRGRRKWKYAQEKRQIECYERGMEGCGRLTFPVVWRTAPAVAPLAKTTAGAGLMDVKNDGGWAMELANKGVEEEHDVR